MEVEIENLKEDNHKLLLKIESLKQAKTVEVEYMREELTLKDIEIKVQTEKSKAELKAREKELLERVNSITEEVHLGREEINDLKEQIEKLMKTIEHLKTTQLERHSRLENYEASKINNEQLAQDLKSKSILLEKQQTKVNQLTTVNDDLRRANANLKEELEGARSCASEYQSRMKDMEREHQEDIVGLQQQIFQQNAGKPNDPNKRGNSLFSEVEERRQKVEEELNKLRSRVAKLTAQNADLQTTIDNGDCRSTIIGTQLQLMQESDAELTRNLKSLKAENHQLFDRYRERMECLRNEYRKKLIQYRDHQITNDSDELENIRSERDRLTVSNMNLERDASDLKRELKCAKQQQIHFEANHKIMRAKMAALHDQLHKLSANKQVNTQEGSPKSLKFENEGQKLSKSILEESKINIDLHVTEPTTSNVAISGPVNKLTNQRSATQANKLQHPEEIQDCKTQ